MLIGISKRNIDLNSSNLEISPQRREKVKINTSRDGEYRLRLQELQLIDADSCYILQGKLTKELTMTKSAIEYMVDKQC